MLNENQPPQKAQVRQNGKSGHRYRRKNKKLYAALDLGTNNCRLLIVERGDGDSFTLTPEERTSGWFARLRGVGGDAFYTISGELSAEEHNDQIGYALRASVSFAM